MTKNCPHSLPWQPFVGMGTHELGVIQGKVVHCIDQNAEW